MGMGRDVIDTHGWQAEVQEGVVVVSSAICTPTCTPERRSMRRQLRNGMGMRRDVIETQG